MFLKATKTQTSTRTEKMIGTVVVPRQPSAKYQSVAGSSKIVSRELSKNIPENLQQNYNNEPKELMVIGTMDTTGNNEMVSNSQTFDCGQRLNLDDINITLDPTSPILPATETIGDLNLNNSSITNSLSDPRSDPRSDHQAELGPAKNTVSCPQCQHVFVPEEPINRKFSKFYIKLKKFYSFFLFIADVNIQLRQMNTKIDALLESNRSYSKKPDDFNVTFPINSIEDLEEWDQRVADDESIYNYSVSLYKINLKISNFCYNYR